MKKILKILISVFILTPCDDFSDVELSSGRASYSNPCIDSLDACFEESIISYEYAVWDIEAKEWIELDYAQNYSSFSDPSGGYNLKSIGDLFFISNSVWDIINEPNFLIQLSFDINSNSFFRNYIISKETYSGNEVPLFFFDGNEKKIITNIDTSDIIKFASNTEEMYFQMKSKKYLQKFDPMNFSLSDTEIDTSIVAGSDYIKLIDRYALFCDLKSYIKLVNIDTGKERSFAISINQNDDVHFRREFLHNLDNAELDNDKIYLSSLYIDEIEGLSTGQSSFI